MADFFDTKYNRVDVLLILREDTTKAVMDTLIEQGYAVMKSSQEVSGIGNMHRLDVMKREG